MIPSRARLTTAVAVAVAVAAAVTAVALADQARQADQLPAFRSRVTLVPIDVKVLDRDGKPVVGLGKEDFAVTEDGVLQEVKHFERHAFVARPPEEGSPIQLRREGALNLWRPDRRVFLIVFRPGYWLPEEPFGLVKAVTRFLRDRLLPQDYAGLLVFDRATDLTTDHDAVARVVERLLAFQASIPRESVGDYYRAFARNGRFGSAFPPSIDAALDRAFNDGTASVRSAPRVPKREISRLLASVTGHAFTFGRFEGDQDLGGIRAIGARNQVLTLFSAIQYLRYVEGEKHVIYFSPRGVYLPAVEDHRDLARIAAGARVVVHVVNTSGSMDVLDSAANKGFAEATGGQAFANQYPDRVLASIEEGTRAGYLLGYYPANGSLDGRYRKLRVTVKRPPGARVLYRRSYQATDEPAPYDDGPFIAQDRVMAAGEHGAAIPDIPVALKAARGQDSINVEATVDASRLALQPLDDRHTGKIELAFFCSDSRQRLLGQVWKSVDFKLRDDTYQRLLSEGYRYSTVVPVKGSAAYVKVVVYDYNADRVGSAIVSIK